MPRSPQSALADACRLAASALIELVLPEQCAACGLTAGGGDPWEAGGPHVRGLRPWDRPHLCVACAGSLFTAPCQGSLDGRGRTPDLSVKAAAATSARLVAVVGAWKYHGVRGLAWPLSRALAASADPSPPGRVLVPVPLHAARRRRRGFNQAAMLADLAGPLLGMPVDHRALRRVRPTAQQARLKDSRAREANLAGAFAAAPPGPCHTAVLVDDLVTAGATVQAAAAALRAAGWEVAGVLALGLALSRRDDGSDFAGGDFVDTPGGAS